MLRMVPGETCLIKSFMFESTAKQKMEKEIDSVMAETDKVSLRGMRSVYETLCVAEIPSTTDEGTDW